MDLIAERVKSIDASGIRKVWQLAQKMQDPIDFSIGIPDFGPSEILRDAAIEAINNGHHTYTLTTGLPELQEAIAERITRELNWQNPNILVTCGVSGAIQLTLMSTINPGDEVIIPDPYFVIYRHIVNLLGGKCVYVDTYPDFLVDPEKIAEKITDKTKLILLNSPSNPSGQVIPADRLQKLAEVLKPSNPLVISDEIYMDFSYEEPVKSIGEYYDNTLIMRGFSKAYGIPGWRLGYLAVPEFHQELFDRMASLQQYTFVCAPHPFQKAILKVLDSDLTVIVDEYRKKRDLIYDGLKDAFDLVRPHGAFYAFVPAPDGHASDFIMEAVKKDVLVVPGSAFSERNTHFRISYATSNEKIQMGVERLCELAGEMKS